VIDDWFTARPLALVVEGKVGPGRIVICGFDLTRDAEDPVSRQMRSSLLDYMGSRPFRPASELTFEQIKSLFGGRDETRLRGISSVKADSAQEGYEPENAVDGDTETLWHTSWEGEPPGFPHELVVEFDTPRRILGFTTLPRQDDKNNGWIKDYAFYVSADGKTWGPPVQTGTFDADSKLQTVKFTSPVTGKFVKLVALSGHAKGPWASLAEFKIIE
jgi:beta-galactosidase